MNQAHPVRHQSAYGPRENWFCLVRFVELGPLFLGCMGGIKSMTFGQQLGVATSRSMLFCKLLWWEHDWTFQTSRWTYFYVCKCLTLDVRTLQVFFFVGTILTWQVLADLCSSLPPAQSPQPQHRPTACATSTSNVDVAHALGSAALYRLTEVAIEEQSQPYRLWLINVKNCSSITAVWNVLWDRNLFWAKRGERNTEDKEQEEKGKEEQRLRETRPGRLVQQVSFRVD